MASFLEKTLRQVSLTSSLLAKPVQEQEEDVVQISRLKDILTKRKEVPTPLELKRASSFSAGGGPGLARSAFRIRSASMLCLLYPNAVSEGESSPVPLIPRADGGSNTFRKNDKD
jgi:hypothetical protein